MDWDIKDLKDLEDKIWRCTACGTCKIAYSYGPPTLYGDICPAGTEFGFEGLMASKGKIAFARGILSGELPWDEGLVEDIYKCTVCAGCQTQCQLDHKPFIPEIIEAMRRRAVREGVGPLAKHKTLLQSLKSYNNPYQGPRRARTDWLRAFKKEGRPIKDINKEPAEILYFVGCTGAFNVNTRGVPIGTASLFQKLGLDFGVLGENELCCGSTAMRIGDVAEFKRLAEENLNTFKRLHQERGVNTIVTSCAGCYRAIKKDYSLAREYQELMEGINVVHTVELLYGLFKEGRLRITGNLEWSVTYHDPCHAGRHLSKFIIDEDGKELWKGAYIGIDESECLYDIPRELLKSIPGLTLIEMERIKANSYCCGGGGGVMTGFGEWATKNAGLRIQEGMATGADYMVSICPFCHYNLNEGAKLIQSPMKVYDLVQLLDQVVEGKQS